jgi:hypothetical protein
MYGSLRGREASRRLRSVLGREGCLASRATLAHGFPMLAAHAELSNELSTSLKMAMGLVLQIYPLGSWGSSRFPDREAVSTTWGVKFEPHWLVKQRLGLRW